MILTNLKSGEEIRDSLIQDFICNLESQGYDVCFLSVLLLDSESGEIIHCSYGNKQRLLK